MDKKPTGRPPGSKNKATILREQLQATAARAVEDFDPAITAKSPLEIMLYGAQFFLQRFQDNGEEADLKSAISTANLAAPYVHAKLAQSKTEVDIKSDVEAMSAEDIVKKFRPTVVEFDAPKS